VSHCAACRQAMTRERKLVQLVRSTVNVATKPDAAQLRSLMPAVPQQRRSGSILSGWQKQLAPALLIFLLSLGGFMLNSMLPARSMPSFVATAHAATATSTNTPTATIVQSMPANNSLDHFSEVTESTASSVAVPVPFPGSGRPLETPDPLPTPIAAVGQSAQ
jgi:hypothetical protein